jgi:hypothetical protein
MLYSFSESQGEAEGIVMGIREYRGWLRLGQGSLGF